MIQEMKANGFSTQILQGEPWSLDLIKPADDGASVQIDYQARVLKKGLYFKMSDGNLLASADGVNFVQMPKSENVAEFRQYTDDKGNTHFEYRVGDKWFGLATSSDIADVYTKTEVDNKVTVLNAGITGNAQAIQKTRDEYIAADSEIHQILNSHADELTTLRGNQASLGDQVSGIEEKIPESASGSNPLITKQQLLDEEMDIRDDLNESVSELQTQITAQAAEIATKQDQLTAGDNIVISGNVISATGAGGGTGFDVQVVQELPATGQKGIIYLLAKDGTAPDVYDEYVWITATQTFELIGTTQVDLSGYAKTVYVDEVANTLRNNQESLYRNQIELRDQLNTKDADGNWTTLTTTAQAAIPAINELNEKIESAGGGTDLPDQTGNSGKFLTTDGTTASWGSALVNRATRTDSLILSDSKVVNAPGAVSIGYSQDNTTTGSTFIGHNIINSTGLYNTLIGHSAGTSKSYATAVGYYASASQGSVAIGSKASATANNSAIISTGRLTERKNTVADTFAFGNSVGVYEVVSADGTIPAERMSATAGTTGQVLTKTDTGMAWADASGGDGDIDCGVMS